MRPTLYLMFGYPGAGKTTTAKIIRELSGAIHLSSDDWRHKLFPDPTFSQSEHDKLYAELDRQTERLLGEGKSVIYDANLNRYKHRHDKYLICERTVSKPVLLWIRTPRVLAKERAVHESRKHLWPGSESAHDMFDRIANIIEEPRSNEQYIEIDGTKVTPEYIQRKLGL